MVRRGFYRMTPARRAAIRKAQLASARKRKGQFHAKNRKKLQSRVSKARGIQEYVTASGKRTGLATNTPSRTFGGAMRKARRASKHNVKYAKKLNSHNKRVNKAIKRVNNLNRPSLATRTKYRVQAHGAAKIARVKGARMRRKKKR